jgi:hypothetical protein
MHHNASKFEKHHVSQLPHSTHSPDRNPCGFGLFGMLKRILKGYESNSSNEIEEAIMIVSDELIFDELQNVFHNWMSRFGWVIESEREYIIK